MMPSSYQQASKQEQLARMGVPEDKYQRFEHWLRENGGFIDLLELREYDDNSSSSHMTDDQPLDLSGAEEKKEAPAPPQSPQEESEHRGVHARQYVPPNTICVMIPRKCLVTVEMGQATPLGQKILHSDLDLDAPKHIFLMIYVLWDRKVNGSRSFFYPYYEILPRTLKNMPIFWSREELALLEGSHLLEQIADRNEAISEDYHSILSVAPELASLATLQEFKWARMCVCSRNFGLSIDGHRTSALVPHADMLNHYRPRETKWTFCEERQAFTITTLQGIPAGAQVYDSYGQKCNHRFLLNYGFAVEDNRELDGFCPNEVPIELSVKTNDPLFAQKVEFWTRGESTLSVAMAAMSARQAPLSVMNAMQEAMQLQNSANSTTAPVKRVRICASNNENTRLLFSLLRSLSCNEEELHSLTHDRTIHNNNAVGAGVDPRLGGSMPPPTVFHRSCRDIRHPISLRNESQAMMLLLEIIGRALAKYPTSLASDVADLMDEAAFPRFSNSRHAKIQVRGEKQVLHHFALWARTATNVLAVMERELYGRVDTANTSSFGNNKGQTFESVIRQLEAEEGVGDMHHTIVRYCADVLGSLRREEIKNFRRKECGKIPMVSDFQR